MTITAQSADGVLHQFPEGTDPAVIDRAMKSYALQPGLEKDAGQTLEGLGLFTGKDRLN